MLTKAAAVILVLVISCTVPVVETPTPRPTYTPYAAQPPDDVSHRRGVLALVRSPDPLQQMLVGQRLPGVDRKLDQHPVLDAGERDGASRHCHPALGIVDGQVSPHVGL